MATAKPAGRKPAGARRRFPWLTTLAVLGAGFAAAWWFYGERISGYAAAGTAYGARTACSCRYLAEREFDSCKGDLVDGMEAVFVSEDEDERSVTAYVPLVSSDTATYREGFGCVLEDWEG